MKIFSLDHDNINHYVQLKSTYGSTTTPCTYFYLSFEDAFWDLINTLQLPSPLSCLLPDFFCMCTAEQFRRHGIPYTFYHLDDTFQPNLEEFRKLLREFRPQFVFIFHPLGILSPLKQSMEWLNDLSPTTVIIEDCSHSLLRRKQISFLNNRHYLIDSIRKVSPLQGSHLFSPIALVVQGQKWHFSALIYKIKTACQYFLWRLLLNLSRFTKSTSLFPTSARLYNIYDDNIGINSYVSKGWFWDDLFFKHINFNKLEHHKEVLAHAYSHALIRLQKINRNFFDLKVKVSDYKNLKAFPIGIWDKILDLPKLISYLENIGIFLRIQYSDCPWSNNKKCLLLPLNPTMNVEDVESLCSHIDQYLRM